MLKSNVIFQENEADVSGIDHPRDPSCIRCSSFDCSIVRPQNYHHPLREPGVRRAPVTWMRRLLRTKTYHWQRFWR